jgi:hypothetical protein
MGIQESLNQVIAELANRRIQLKQVGDPNLSSSLDGALTGTTVLQTDSVPQVIWRKLRAGSNGWDVEQVLPIEPNHYRYVDQSNTAPGQNGSFANPFSNLQDAYDSILPAINQADYDVLYMVHVLSDYVHTGDLILPECRSVITVASQYLTVNGNVYIPADFSHYAYPSLAFFSRLHIGFCNDLSSPSMAQGTISINGKLEYLIANPTYSIFNELLLEANMGSPTVGGAIIIPAGFALGAVTCSNSNNYGMDMGGGVFKSIVTIGHALRADSCYFTSLVEVHAVVGDYTMFLGGLNAPWQLQNGMRSGLIQSEIRGAWTGPPLTGSPILQLDNASQNEVWTHLRNGSLTLTQPINFTDAESYIARNTDIDIVTSPEVVDQFPYTLANACDWEVLVSRGTTQFRRCKISAVWTSDGLSINTQGETKLAEVGVTSDLSLSVSILTTNVRLMATAVNTNDWVVKAKRILALYNI